MNLLRQTAQIPVEQMHGFLKDKNAWENAISMYQGPDPLDHWYNYICWYENHRHGDPENQFRQTLERCLSIFEHTDFYKQDARMVRLWLKYIDMQPNPLHFYQVLHTRGVGKQIAAFYISWASYYESVNALKEAEAVYNVAFKEKAQSYAELHHAHSKFLYAHSSSVPSTPVPTVSTVQQLHLQQQQYQPVQHIAQQPTHHSPEVEQNAYSQVAVQQQQVHRQQVQPQATIQSQNHPVNVHHHPNATHLNIQAQNYRPQVVFQQATHQPQQQIVYQQRIDVNNTYNHPHQHQQQVHQPQFQQTQLNNQQNTYLQQQLAQPLTPPMGVPIEQQLPATTVQQQQQQQQLQYYSSQQIQQIQQSRIASTADSQQVAANQDQLTDGLAATSALGIKLPKKFANFSRNNYETWKPALFLEEPDDPLRKCHYQKQLVYPDGANIEYSPEELYARKYLKRMQAQQREPEEQKTYVQIPSWEPVQAVVYDQQQQEQLNQQQEERVFQQISTYNQVQPQQNVYISSNGNNVYQLSATNGGQVAGTAAAIYQTTADDVGGEQDDFEGYEQTCEEEEEDDEDDDYDYEEDYDETVSQSQQTHNAQEQQSSVVNTLDDLEDQIEASTIRFSMHSEQQGVQNKTIKIKFRKEPPTKGVATTSSNSFNSSYSAYSVSVQGVYQNQQQQVKTNTNIMNSPKVRSNGHSFHPYMISQTSTPKSVASTSGLHRSHNRSKLKKINKFPITTASSSNSSSAENGGGCLQNGHNTNVVNSSLHNATFNDNANYSFSSAVALDNSNCSLSSAVDRLNFRDSTFGGGAGQTSKLNSTNVVDFSTYQENSYFATQHDTEAKERRLQKALATIATHFEKAVLDPFNSELCRAFLTKLDFPNTNINAATVSSNVEDGEASQLPGSYLKIVQTPLPKLSNARALYLPEAGNLHFNIDKEVGRGSYGSVFKATDANTGTVVALKYQKPPNTWEIYICDQVLKRIKSPNILPGLMDISAAIVAPNASLIATEFSPFGSLLDVNNKIRQNTTKVMHESLVMHFSAQICNIIYYLHQQKIIHADIKPDNFLLMRIPSTETYLPSLRLIDFGCAIDMTLFPDPDKQKFRKVIQTDGFTCIEMQEGRTWSYETDIFCIAGTVHVMLFGEYMQVQKRAGVWDIKQKLPRYLKKQVWTKFFGEVLNIKNDKLPDLKEFREIFDEEASKMDSELQKQIRRLSNILYRR